MSQADALQTAWGPEDTKQPGSAVSLPHDPVDETDASHGMPDGTMVQWDPDQERAPGEIEVEPEEEEKPFREFTRESMIKLIKRERYLKEKLNSKKDPGDEGRLVDGEIVFDDIDDDLKVNKDAKLAEGMALPEKLGRFPKDLLGKPLEEIDKYIKYKSYVTVAKKFSKTSIFRFSATKSFFLFDPTSLFRRMCIQIISNQFFDFFILFTIVVNCVFLIIPNPPESPEFVFLAIYTMEMIIKMTARGVILNKHTYLRDGWNWLDFVVVVISYVTTILDQIGGANVNLSGLRAFRVMRALKGISVVPGLRTIVNALLKSLKMLGEVMLLTLFCIMIFSLLALQLYRGILRQKCVSSVDYSFRDNITSIGSYYTAWVTDTSHYMVSDGAFVLCGNVTDATHCPNGYFCLEIGENPNFGFTHFDAFHWAMLNCFQMVTMDFWEDTYNKIIEVSGPWNLLYFALVVFFGSFYLVNLMLAVVAMAYEQEADAESKLAAEEEEEERAKAKRKENTAMLFDPKKLKLQLAQKQKEESEMKEERTTSTPTANDRPLSMDSHSRITDSPGGGGISTSQRRPVTIHGNFLVPAQQPASTQGGKRLTDVETSEGRNSSPSPTKTASSDATATGVEMFADVERAVANIDEEAVEEEEEDDEEEEEIIRPVTEKHRRYLIQKFATLWLNKIRDDDNKLVDRNCLCCSRAGSRGYHTWIRFQSLVLFKVVNDGLFELFITLCIGANTLMMASEYHGMTDHHLSAMEIGNQIFTFIFTMEAILKLLALSKDYFKVGWNVFDMVIVICSLLDLALYYSNLDDVPGLSVVTRIIKIFRLLRIIKLAQSWGTMRTLLIIIFNTLGALGNLTMILLIIIFIFAVLGNQLLGENYEKFTNSTINPELADFGNVMPRWHFFDFYHSFLMVFRILCGEFIEPLWDCMRVNSEAGCSLLFIGTLILGNFMVLNLFLALLLNAFGTDSIKQEKPPEEEENKIVTSLKRIAGCFTPKKKLPPGPPVTDFDLYFYSSRFMNGHHHLGGEILPNCITARPFDQQLYTMNEVTDEQIANNGSGMMELKVIQANGIANGDNTSMASISRPLKALTDGANQAEETQAAVATVEKAFTAPRTDYTSFEDAMVENQNSPNPLIVTEDFSDQGERKKSVYIPEDLDKLETGDVDRRKSSIVEKKDKDEDEDMVENTPDCLCLFCYPNWSKVTEPSSRWTAFRKLCAKFATHKIFEGFILILIVLSSFALVFEDVYLIERPQLADVLTYLNFFFAAIFFIEMLVKWFAMGLRNYFTSFWTILDFVIVAISLFDIVASFAGLASVSAFRSLRTLRALRPLRAVSRWEGMKIVVNALIFAMPAIFNVLLVCIVFWLIFSILGVQAFAGKFFKCLDEEGELVPLSIVANMTECLAKNYEWKNTNINFDNVFSGYLALYQVATFEGWMEIMDSAVDAPEKVGDQAYHDANIMWYIYFVIFIVFGAFFTLNLFIGVIIENFNELKKQYDGSYLASFLTDNQRHYYNTLKKLGNKKPQKTIRRPKNRGQAFFYDVAMDNKFEIAITLIIFLNMITMMLDHYGQSREMTMALEYLNVVFTIIFTCEAIVKITGLRLHYFRKPWNVFDFIIVVLSLVGIFLAAFFEGGTIIPPNLLRVVRVFRIGRVLRLVKAAKGIRKLLFALIISLPALFNIAALLFLFMFIFSILGMSMFSRVLHTDALNEQVNFQTFGKSITLLFRLCTSAGWNDVLEPLYIQAPDCNSTHYQVHQGVEGAAWYPLDNGNCSTPWFAVTFFMLFLFICFMIIINMYIAVILENFNIANEQEEIGITEDDFDMFYVVWEKYDPAATQYIQLSDISEFIGELEDPFGLPKPNSMAIVAFNLPIVEGDRVHCLDILMALVKKVLKTMEESEQDMSTDHKEANEKLKQQIADKYKDAFPQRSKVLVISTTMQRKKEDVAAKTLQRAWRNHKMRQNILRIKELALESSMRADDSLSHKESMSHRISDAIGSIRSRIGSALSRRASQRSSRRHSIDSNTLALPPDVVKSPKKYY